MNRLSLAVYFRLVLIAFTFVSLVSCEKEVHISMKSSPSQIVVQGAIETGVPPYVFLTSTIGFFSKVDLNTLQNSFIHGANITVTDGTDTVHLIEYAFDTGSANKFYIYTIDTASPSGLMYGQVGKYYTLTIQYDGKTYTSVTKIPTPKNVDSIWFDIPLLKNSRTPDSAIQLFINYTDPDTPGNYVRYYTRRNSGQFFPSDQFNDEVVNGKLLSNIPLYAGFEHTKDVKEDSMRYFYPGDTVTLKWSEIDKNVYDFWNTYAYALNALGNPFASPINLKSNMVGGALGIWAGYGSVETTIIAKH